MIPPPPMPWHPVPSITLVPIHGTVNVIWAVANFNEYPRGGACCRQESRHEKQRCQQKSMFMFHSLLDYFVYRRTPDGFYSLKTRPVATGAGGSTHFPCSR